MIQRNSKPSDTRYVTIEELYKNLSEETAKIKGNEW